MDLEVGIRQLHLEGAAERRQQPHHGDVDAVILEGLPDLADRQRHELELQSEIARQLVGHLHVEPDELAANVEEAPRAALGVEADADQARPAHALQHALPLLAGERIRAAIGDDARLDLVVDGVHLGQDVLALVRADEGAVEVEARSRDGEQDGPAGHDRAP